MGSQAPGFRDLSVPGAPERSTCPVLYCDQESHQ